MNGIYSHGSFEPMPRRWSTMAASLGVHALFAAGVVVLGTVTASVVLEEKPETDLTFVQVAPPPPPPVRVPVRLPPPVFRDVKVETPPIPIDVPREPEPVVARNEPTPPPAPESPRPVPEPPKAVPQVTVGSFAASGNSVRAAEVARPVVQAGFDAAAARAPEIRTAMAAVGSFEQAAGSGRPRPGTDRANVVGDAGFGAGVTTGKGRGGAGGTVTSGGFGSGVAGGTGTGARAPQAVKTTDFDTRDAQQPATPPVRTAPTERPIEILSKPIPQYTDEARAKRIEGDVVLEVEFTSAGEIRVLRVVRGLGYGLDESATRAVQAMRFKPAQRNGEPVDIRTTVNIAFRLA